MHLRHLDLSDNCIGTEGTRALSFALSRMTTLDSLDLSGNKSSLTLDELRMLKSRLSKAAAGRKISSVFDRIDKDKSGVIDIYELSDAVKRFLPDVTMRELTSLMKDADTSGDGLLDREEFVSFFGESGGSGSFEVSDKAAGQILWDKPKMKPPLLSSLKQIQAKHHPGPAASGKSIVTAEEVVRVERAWKESRYGVQHEEKLGTSP